VVLDSLATFLKHALASEKTSAAEDSRSGPSPTLSWFMASSFTTPDAFSAFDSALLPSSSFGSKDRRWQEQVGPDTMDEAPLDFYPLARAPLGDEINLQELSHLVVVSATTNDVRTSVAAVSGPCRPKTWISDIYHLTAHSPGALLDDPRDIAGLCSAGVLASGKPARGFCKDHARDRSHRVSPIRLFTEVHERGLSSVSVRVYRADEHFRMQRGTLKY
jgi:hypothetical protein